MEKKKRARDDDESATETEGEEEEGGEGGKKRKRKQDGETRKSKKPKKKPGDDGSYRISLICFKFWLWFEIFSWCNSCVDLLIWYYQWGIWEARPPDGSGIVRS